jgi:hypothetical protein
MIRNDLDASSVHPDILGNYRFVNMYLSSSRRAIASRRVQAIYVALERLARSGCIVLGTAAEPTEAGSDPALRVAIPALAEVAPRRWRRGPETAQQPGEHRAFGGETEHI